MDTCPIRLMLGGDFYDCSLPRGHAGRHSYSEPSADSDPSAPAITVTLQDLPSPEAR